MTDLLERLEQIADTHDGPLVPSTCREARTTIESLTQERDKTWSKLRDTLPCGFCGWPKGTGDQEGYICPCCGFQPGYDDKMSGVYQWSGEWWDSDEAEPQILVRLKAKLEAAEADRDRLVAQLETVKNEKTGKTL